MNSKVYPPSEDTFLLADSAVDADSAVEVGCGSGVATEALARRSTYLVAVDIHLEAAVEAWRRIGSSTLGSKVDVVVADVLTPFRDEAFHVVYSNPPYLPCPYVGEELWCGGEEGVEFALRLSAQAWRKLRKGGLLVLIASTLSNIGRLLEFLEDIYVDVEIARRLKVGLYEELLLVKAFKGT